MGDLLLGIGLLAILSAALFAAAARLGRTLPIRRAQALALVAVAALGLYFVLLHDRPVLAEWLPFSNLIVVGNWLPPLLSVIGGLAWSLIPRSGRAGGGGAGHATRAWLVTARRVAAVVLLEAVGWYAVARPLVGKPPRCLDRWQGDICVQTSEKSCTAACAATLLRAHGIPAAEPEMAELCLTREGTTWQGLYRGLMLKTAGTPWTVNVIRGPLDVLRAPSVGPAELAVGIPRGARVPAIYTEQYGWKPGEWHSVLFYRFRDNGRVAMGEPSPGVGHEDWTEEDLRVLWRGRGMRLVRRRG